MESKFCWRESIEHFMKEKLNLPPLSHYIICTPPKKEVNEKKKMYLLIMENIRN